MSAVRISCRHASRLLSQREDAPLPFGARTRLWLHLCVCDACSAVARQFASIRLAMQRLRDGD
ncbi:MAG TPA: hypothetical protein VF132_13655 [Rudaea sp.]